MLLLIHPPDDAFPSVGQESVLRPWKGSPSCNSSVERGHTALPALPTPTMDQVPERWKMLQRAQDDSLLLKVTENMLLPQNSGKFRASLKGHLGGERTSSQG